MLQLESLIWLFVTYDGSKTRII